MMDRVIKMTETGGNFDKGYVEAELDINPDLWFFRLSLYWRSRDCLAVWVWMQCGSWLVSTWAGWVAKAKAVRSASGEVKFTGQVLPTAKKVTYRIHFKRIVNRRLIMGLADGEVLVDGRLIYTANDLKVGLFQDTSAF
ncbi:3-hydroxydecanoyl-[acyl-carrier-protein] dehydratase [Kluyvera cryocrescens]|uniref:3-hydroxydecanoyl-[acyl-carrier-protein] dehydratase n=1 Tax=Kluyvera cryocrescens TaxID=580 RepID=A0A485CWQ4_KLUCR|nr:3-hydroxydecanoyl-[acyl-carrier-protein] dehydratase [Kluyvera cryocrescens]